MRYNSIDRRYRRGVPIGYDERGWAIFGYNDEGKPICFAIRSNGERCHSAVRYPNGRCRMHGGPKSTKNIMAKGTFRQKLYQGKLPKELGLILADAVEDPEAHSLKEELGVNTVQIARLLSAIGAGQDDADQSTWQEVLKLTEELEKLLFDPAVQSVLALGGAGHKTEKMASVAEKLVLRVRRGADQSKLFSEINRATEYRRKLIETDMKRVQMARNMIPANEAVQLFKNIINIVKQIFYKDSEGLRELARRLDKASLDLVLKYQDNSLGAKVTPGGFIDPSSEVGDDLRQMAEESELKYEPIEEISEYDGEGTLEDAYPSDKIGKGSISRKPKLPQTLIRRKGHNIVDSGGQEKGFVQNDRPVPKKISFD